MRASPVVTYIIKLLSTVTDTHKVILMSPTSRRDINTVLSENARVITRCYAYYKIIRQTVLETYEIMQVSFTSYKTFLYIRIFH